MGKLLAVIVAILLCIAAVTTFYAGIVGIAWWLLNAAGLVTITPTVAGCFGVGIALCLFSALFSSK